MLKLSIKELLQTIKPELEKFAHKLQTNAINTVDDEGLVYHGRLRRSIQTKLILDDDNPRIELFVYDSGKGEHKYAQYLHEGLKPHNKGLAAVEPLKKWVITKGIHKKDFQEAWEKAKMANKDRKKQGEASVKRLDLENSIATSIAIAIAKKFKHHGRKPQPFLELAIKMTLNRL